jgi:hypothetical protein
MAHRLSSGQEDYIGDAEVLRLLERARQGFEGGDKSQLMWCVYRCARFQAVIPEWAVDALLAIQDDMESGRIADFNGAFGKPSEKVNTRAARERKKKLAPEVLIVLTRLRADGSSLNDDEMFGEALEILRGQGFDVNHRDIQDIYKSDGGFIKKIPRKPSPKQGNYTVASLMLPSPRRRGRNTLQD